MEKLIYLLGRGPGADTPQAEDALRDALIERTETLRAAGAHSCTISAADLDDPVCAGVYQRDAEGLLSASVSLWVDSVDQRFDFSEILEGLAPRTACYLATESVPRDWANRDWADGERSPGVALVSVFRKPDRLEWEEFYARWHGSHTPLSLEIHPLTHYNRNSLVRCLTEGAPPYAAFVSESVASLEIAADPNAFYGGEEGQKRAFEDLMRFTDMQDLRTVLMSEYILIS